VNVTILALFNVFSVYVAANMYIMPKTVHSFHGTGKVQMLNYVPNVNRNRDVSKEA
jgi:hypothetical protein